MTFRVNIDRQHLVTLVLALAVLALCLPQPATAGGSPKTFATPEKAVSRLADAVKAENYKKLVAIFGPGSEAIVSSGDKVADRTDWQEFLAMYGEKHVIDMVEPDRALLMLGEKKYPFPIPLVKKGSKWLFDAAAGRDEMLNRRIGRNELSAIQVAHAYVDAQREYAAKDRDADGLPAFAQRFRSSPGKKDGLYWEGGDGGEESPFGPLIARAAQEGYPQSGNETLAPYHGYYFKILTAQGGAAEGGAYDYIVKGKLLLGFALLAYPAQYGSSGIMSFIVNQGGTIHQKDLGPDTVDLAKALKEYSPDETWKKLD